VVGKVEGVGIASGLIDPGRLVAGARALEEVSSDFRSVAESTADGKILVEPGPADPRSGRS
jgi:hypothetical protein